MIKKKNVLIQRIASFLKKKIATIWIVISKRLSIQTTFTRSVLLITCLLFNELFVLRKFAPSILHDRRFPYQRNQTLAKLLR